MKDAADTAPRILGAIRQSKTRRDAISPEVQRDKIADWATASGGTVIKFTYDLSTSGGSSAFKHKGLGPWLIDPDKAAAWDVLVSAKLDRACRDVADYLKLRAWCDRRGGLAVPVSDFENETDLIEKFPGGISPTALSRVSA